MQSSMSPPQLSGCSWDAKCCLCLCPRCALEATARVSHESSMSPPQLSGCSWDARCCLCLCPRCALEATARGVPCRAQCPLLNWVDALGMPSVAYVSVPAVLWRPLPGCPMRAQCPLLNWVDALGMPGVAYVSVTRSSESLLLTINYVDIQCQEWARRCYKSHSLVDFAFSLLPVSCYWHASVVFHKIFVNIIVIYSP